MIHYSTMALCVVVADHTGSGLDVLATLSAGVPGVGPELVASGAVDGVVALATCNRVELYLDVPEDAVAGTSQHATRALAARAALSGARYAHPQSDRQEQLVRSPFAPAGCPHLIDVRTQRDAVVHLFGVASGLESMVVGEREIVGQVRGALSTAREQHTTTPLLEAAFQTALRVSRTVVGAVPLDVLGRSAVSEALDLAQVSHNGARALLVGTGSYAGASLAALRARGVYDVRVFSGSGRAEGFAERHQVVPATDLFHELRHADVVVTCSGTGPVLGADQVAAAREGRPLVLVDLALRRDVAPEVATLPGVRLVALADVGAACCDPDVAAARALVDAAADAFMRERQVRDWSPPVIAARARMLRACVTGVDNTMLARRAAHRIMHTPTIRAKWAAASGDRDAYTAALAELEALADAAERQVHAAAVLL
ncbi:MAG: glutamyl-tRNA reductase [Micrococcales bacterium]|nr:glutamyl-tRNA reductase [Micrococcales bacterium]MCL2668135.1 glutamyl-tRNA reductase [Micrococcales bacterium]